MTGLPAHLVTFVAALRRHGVAVGPGETIDAARVFTALDLLEREQLREGLAAAVLRRGAHRPVFDTLFDLYFPVRLGTWAGDGPDDGSNPAARLEELRNQLAELLGDADVEGEDGQAALRELAGRVLDELGVASVAAESARWSAHRALDRLAPQTLLARVMAGMAAGAPGLAEDGMAGELARREIRDRIARFRSMVQQEAVRRVSQQRGRERVARSVVPKAPEQREFLSARSDELVELRRMVVPLARRLATRLAARRRRAHRGALDLRRTLRRSMSTGGVPMHPVRKKPRPTRPELVLLCDVSSSVSGFSHFTLLLVQALAEQFSKVRVFAFIDKVDEVTHMFTPGVDATDAMRRVITEADVSSAGRSDYGEVLGDFAADFTDAVTPRCALLILGDARTNYGDPNVAALASLSGSARHAHWLNPEPMNRWGTGDSAAPRYAKVIPMHECRNAAQLADVVAGLLPV